MGLEKRKPERTYFYYFTLGPISCHVDLFSNQRFVRFALDNSFPKFEGHLPAPTHGRSAMEELRTNVCTGGLDVC